MEMKMEIIRVPKSTKTYLCKKCDFKCYKQSGYDRHLLTAKHNLEIMENTLTPESAEPYYCLCGKSYKVYSGLWKHKKKCLFIANSNKENLDEKPSLMDIIIQNKEIMDMLVLQNKELQRQNKEQSDTIRELIPKIGNNNTITTNNQFNIQNFLNEDCKDALNFSEFLEQIQITFQDLENQAETGYTKGITKLFLENLQGLGTNKRPIHCSDKKRKTIYVKENDEWDKEGSHDTLKKGIQEITRRTFLALMKEKQENPVEYSDMDSEFSMKCLDIQRNLTPEAPRETSIGRVISNISENTMIS
jgi:hypothetical protein